MAHLETRNGIVNARVFLAESEDHIGIVLERNRYAVAARGFDQMTWDECWTVICDWLSPRHLNEDSFKRLAQEARDAFRSLELRRTRGPDISQDWQGSRSTRRLPSHVD